MFAVISPPRDLLPSILLQYSAITRTPLESSRLGELKYAISAGYDVRLKNKSLRKCKNDCAMSVHGHSCMGCQRNRHFYFDTATQAIKHWIALDSMITNMHLQQDST